MLLSCLGSEDLACVCARALVLQEFRYAQIEGPAKLIASLTAQTARAWVIRYPLSDELDDQYNDTAMLARSSLRQPGAAVKPALLGQYRCSNPFACLRRAVLSLPLTGVLRGLARAVSRGISLHPQTEIERLRRENEQIAAQSVAMGSGYD